MAIDTDHLLQLQNKTTLILNGMEVRRKKPVKNWASLLFTGVFTTVLVYSGMYFQELRDRYPDGFLFIFILLAVIDFFLIISLMRLFFVILKKLQHPRRSRPIMIRGWKKIEISEHELQFLDGEEKRVKMIPIEEIASLNFHIHTTESEYFDIDITPMSRFFNFFYNPSYHLLLPNYSYLNQAEITINSESGLKFLRLEITLYSGQKFNTGAIWYHNDIHFLTTRTKKVKELVVGLKILPSSAIHV